ncbi:hypothetical protein DRQ36_08630 [bacterium]|nr:MAG: hypothetical protein DRQ36_08630 [bacterium]
MRKLFVIASLLIILSFSALTEEVQYKVSVGPGGGVIKTGGVYDYWALGTTYGGLAKFGITKDLEIGIQGGYGYVYPGGNIEIFPFLLRDAETKAIIDHTYFHPKGNGFRFNPDPPPITTSYTEKARFSMERNEDMHFRLNFIPIELFFQWRSFTHTIFNPYIQFGGGLLIWNVTDENSGEVLQVADIRDEYSFEYTDSVDHLPESSLHWTDYKGRYFQAMLGFGFEVFPVEQVGIDLGFRGYYPFKDDFGTYVLDTLSGVAEISARLNFYYGGVRDTDKDGVINKDDQCPDTPFGAIVDEFGCPVDSDGDGVYDGLDQCPNTPIGAVVDAVGCPSDGDGDGVYDGIDKCPDTPPGAKVDETGCPVDSDGDGVPDHTDNCPNTPKGALVDAKGCPFDGDGDGVYDGIDKCPNTPLGTQVNEYGCPQVKADTDGDGVTDDIDRCPATPRGVKVDEVGCPVDSDKDQVPDHKDKCPKTPAGCIVDEEGCPVDGDNDGVCDGVDKCPNTPPDVEVKEDGCPKAKMLKKGESIRVKVYFDTAKWDITPQGAMDLQEALRILKAYPQMRVLIEGHTDSQGSDEYNRELSIKRAMSVKSWLVTQGIASDRLETIGYGETRPVDTNDTSAGRANNRRIEFRCIEGCAEEVEEQ